MQPRDVCMTFTKSVERMTRTSVRRFHFKTFRENETFKHTHTSTTMHFCALFLIPLRLACTTRRRKRRVLSEPTTSRRRYPAAAERVENTLHDVSADKTKATAFRPARNAHEKYCNFFEMFFSRRRLPTMPHRREPNGGQTRPMEWLRNGVPSSSKV